MARRSDPCRATRRKRVPFQAEDRRIRRPAHPGSVLGDGVHDRLQIGRRARDHPQDLGRGGLLLERLFRLVEQPHVLDGDDRLGGEGLEQRDLRVGERPRLARPARRRSRRSAAPRAASAPPGRCGSRSTRERARNARRLRVGLDVGHVDGRRVDHDRRDRGLGLATGHRVRRPQGLVRLGSGVVVGARRWTTARRRSGRRARRAAVAQPYRARRRWCRRPAGRRSASSR